MGFSLKFWKTQSQEEQGPEIPITVTEVVSDNNQANYGGYVRYVVDDGEKYSGGFGATEIGWTDYWTLRARSAQLFERNHYARGLIRRRLQNTIVTGLKLEARPDELLLGYERHGLKKWSDRVEALFSAWADSAELVDIEERKPLWMFQHDLLREGSLDGDVLVTLPWDRVRRLPKLRLIPGGAVETPIGAKPRAGNTITLGVERDPQGRHVAYWVRQDDGSHKRMPAFGEKSGRRLAWLIHGSDARLADVRCKPRLALYLQSLREIDRYRDSTQRKATLNSMIAMAIERDNDGPAPRAFTAGGGALRRDAITGDAATGEAKRYEVQDGMPGVIVDRLQPGERLKPFSTSGTDASFSEFENSQLSSIAYTDGISPEVYRMEFGKSFSASQAANNEFKIGLEIERTYIWDMFMAPLYEEWFVSQVLNGKIDAPGFLEAYRDPNQYEISSAWMKCNWGGQVKPSVDINKLVNAHVMQIKEGLMTRKQSARELNGSDYDKNVIDLALENIALATANAPLVELEAKSKQAPESGDASGDDEKKRRSQHSNDEDDEGEDEDEAEALERRRLRVVD